MDHGSSIKEVEVDYRFIDWRTILPESQCSNHPVLITSEGTESMPGYESVPKFWSFPRIELGFPNWGVYFTIRRPVTSPVLHSEDPKKARISIRNPGDPEKNADPEISNPFVINLPKGD